MVRLIGGDPVIFGRGGKEAERLRAQGIAVEAVNGITAGLAAVTSLGVPLTHREHAHGVILVTAHARADGEPMDWRSLAAAAAQGLTLVVYMGVTSIDALQAGLLQPRDRGRWRRAARRANPVTHGCCGTRRLSCGMGTRRIIRATSSRRGPA